MTISIAGIDKAAVLAALWNNAALPPAAAHPNPRLRPMMIAEARSAIVENDGGFDYHEDRILKINVQGDDFDPWGYDRDNGQGLAERVISTLRATGSVDKLAAV